MNNVKPDFTTIYTPFANTTQDWLVGDIEEFYLKNLKTKFDLLQSNGWIDYKFNYKFNSYGFRCKEFTKNPTLMTLGCSMTVGIGLPVEHIWPELVAKNLNLECANLGIGGSSHDTAFRMCYGYIDIVKPKLVILMGPARPRFEVIHDNNACNLTPVSVAINGDDSFFKTMIHPQNEFFNFQKNYLAIKLMCMERNIKFLYYPTTEFVWVANDYARDLSHPGIKAHELTANKILKKL